MLKRCCVWRCPREFAQVWVDQGRSWSADQLLDMKRGGAEQNDINKILNDLGDVITMDSELWTRKCTEAVEHGCERIRELDLSNGPVSKYGTMALSLLKLAKLGKASGKVVYPAGHELVTYAAGHKGPMTPIQLRRLLDAMQRLTYRDSPLLRDLVDAQMWRGPWEEMSKAVIRYGSLRVGTDDLAQMVLFNHWMSWDQVMALLYVASRERCRDISVIEKALGELDKVCGITGDLLPEDVTDFFKEINVLSIARVVTYLDICSTIYGGYKNRIRNIITVLLKIALQSPAPLFPQSTRLYRLEVAQLSVKYYNSSFKDSLVNFINANHAESINGFCTAAFKLASRHAVFREVGRELVQNVDRRGSLDELLGVAAASAMHKGPWIKLCLEVLGMAVSSAEFPRVSGVVAHTLHHLARHQPAESSSLKSILHILTQPTHLDVLDTVSLVRVTSAVLILRQPLPPNLITALESSLRTFRGNSSELYRLLLHPSVPRSLCVAIERFKQGPRSSERRQPRVSDVRSGDF